MMIRRIGSDSPLTPQKRNSVSIVSSANDIPEADDETEAESTTTPKRRQNYPSNMFSSVKRYMNSTRLVVLLVLCLQNSMFTILRRYSQGVLKETYSKHELLLVAEIIKLLYSAWMIRSKLTAHEEVVGGSISNNNDDTIAPPRQRTLRQELEYLVSTSKKMMVLALIYGAMNILSFISLRNISAGMFTIFAQTKILTTATFSTLLLQRKYSWTKWRALIALMMGVLLFSEPIWGKDGDASNSVGTEGNPFLGTVAVLIEVSLSGFASIYFEKVIKTDPLQLGIWERNFQLALGSIPVYLIFIAGGGGGTAGFLGGWSPMAALLSVLGAAGGLLVALSIKHGDSILKTLATTGAIVLTGLLDSMFLGGPLTPSMIIAAIMVIIAICNYTFDATPNPPTTTTNLSSSTTTSSNKISDPHSSSAPLNVAGGVGDSHTKETELLLRKV